MGAVNPDKLKKKYKEGGVAKNFPPATKFKQVKR